MAFGTTPHQKLTFPNSTFQNKNLKHILEFLKIRPKANQKCLENSEINILDAPWPYLSSSTSFPLWSCSNFWSFDMIISSEHFCISSNPSPQASKFVPKTHLLTPQHPTHLLWSKYTVAPPLPMPLPCPLCLEEGEREICPIFKSLEDLVR